MSDFVPEIHERPLPDGITADRRDYGEALQPIKEVLEPRLDGHIQAYRMALEPLIANHLRLGEETGLDLAAETRWVAIWEMGGRCLALSNALIDQLARGYGSETVGTARVLHEAANLLMSFLEDEPLTRRWLREERIRPREARDVVSVSYEETVAELARVAGEQLVADLGDTTRQVYGYLSRGAHNDRASFADAISRELREFSYGPHPDPRVRAVYVEFGGELIEQIVMEVGHALGQMIGGNFYMGEVKPLVEAIHAVREALPIGRDVRAALGYGG